MYIKNEYGTSFISVSREQNKISISIDSCHAELSVKEAKQLIKEIKKAILCNNEDKECKKDSLEKLGEDYGLTPEGVRFAIEQYQTVIDNITGGKLSKLNYDADYVLEEAEEYYKQKYERR